MSEEFTYETAMSFDGGYGDKFKVSVTFDDGSPSGVSFLDPDSGAQVSVPFEFWARTVSCVEKCVDLNRFDRP